MPNEWVSKKRCSAVLGWRLLSRKLPTQTRQFLQRDGAYKLPTQVRQIAPWKPAQRTVSQRVSGINMLPTRKHFLTPKRALAFPHERHRAYRLKVPSGRWGECAVQDNVS